MGAVWGMTVRFQFGTNGPGYMERAGNIAGPLLGYEILTAFFLEASFLGSWAGPTKPKAAPTTRCKSPSWPA